MSESGQIVFDTANRLFEDLFPHDALARAESGEWLDAEWASLVEMGFPGALLPEDAGGVGLDPLEALELIRIAGFHAVPLPLAETMMATWWLAQAGLTIPSGPLTMISGPCAEALTLRPEGDGWRLTGTAKRIAWGQRAAALAAIIEGEGRGHAALVRREQWDAASGRNLAGEPRDDLMINAVLACADVVDLPDELGQGRAWAMGAAMRGLAMAGALERILALTVQYASERVQFGRAIGKFQAIQQSMAVLAGQMAAARGAADLAAEAVASGLPDLLPVAAAKVRIGEAASSATAITHQIHGAIGFTREHVLHFLSMRLWSWRDEFGNEGEWAKLIGRRALATGGPGLWPLITAA